VALKCTLIQGLQAARGPTPGCQSLCDAKCELGAPNPDEVYEIKKSGERLHRKAVRLALQKEGLYEEWDVAAQEGLSEAEVVNRTSAENVSI
jgi:hypothetical protein